MPFTHTSEFDDAEGLPVEDVELETERHENRASVMELLDECRHWWEARSDFRSRRQRSRDYYRGQHWNEIITDPDNPDSTVRESVLIERQGRTPWKMNHIGAAVRNLKGQYRQNRSERAVYAVNRQDNEATEMLAIALRGVRRRNRAHTVEADQFEEHIMSGASAWRVGIEYDSNLNRNEVTIDPVEQTRLFFNLDVRDRRLKDIRIIGELHDLTMGGMIAAFAHDADGNYDRKIAARIRSFYSEYRGYQYDRIADYGTDYSDSIEFWDTHDTGTYRVVEVWKQRHEMVRYAHDQMDGSYDVFEGDDMVVASVNAEREAAGLPQIKLSARSEAVWYCYFLSPYGDVLFEQKTPYWHEGHPYVVGMANLIDGDTWGLVETIIDPQRWMNRLVAAMDHSMSAAAKGVLLVPEESIPDDMDLDDFSETWSRANGVIKIKVKPGHAVPTQIANSAVSNDAWKMLENLKAWIQEVSGITGPMQGFNPKSGTPAALYQQQVVQASTTNLDYFESFFEGTQNLDRKTLQTIMQAYEEVRDINEPSARAFVGYNPERVREIEADVAVGNVADTATYRQLWEKDLQEFLGGGHIDFMTYLEMSSHPKADSLLKIIQRQAPQMGGMDIMGMQAALTAQPQLLAENPTAQ